jgi:hypothetical protein
MQRDPKEEAFKLGQSLSHLTGAESLTVFNPYDPDTEPELWDAWDEGFNGASDIRSEMIHLGI